MVPAKELLNGSWREQASMAAGFPERVAFKTGIASAEYRGAFSTKALPQGIEIDAYQAAVVRLFAIPPER